MQFSAHYEGELDKYLKNSEEQRRKAKEENKTTEVHVYRPEDYGLTAKMIREEFAGYIAQYC